MAEQLWNGFLRISLVSCAVHLSPAISAGRRVRLDDVNSRTGNPLAEQFVDSKTGDVVAPTAVAKGYQADASRYVIVSNEELKALAGVPGNILDVEQFVPRGQIDPIYIDGSCYIRPEGQIAADTVHALSLAMERNGRVGIGRIVLGGRERVVMIQPLGSGLMLSTLHSADEVEPAGFPERSVSELPSEMVEVADTIMGRRSRDFAPSMLQDRTETALRALLEEKGRSAAPSAPPSPAEPPASVAAAAEPEPAAAAAGSEAPEPEPAAAAPPQPVYETPPPPAPEPPPEAEALPPQPAPEAPSEPTPEPAPAALEAAFAEAAVPLPEPEREPEPSPQPLHAERRDLGAEVLLHIMGLGDRRYVESGWAGNPGSRRQIEALSIRPRAELPATAVEFRVFAREGRATAWVSNGNYAGTRGRGLPLTGFSIRAAEGLRDKLEITYEGAFFEGGIVGPKHDGELCMSPVSDDPLEAVRITISERAAE